MRVVGTKETYGVVFVISSNKKERLFALMLCKSGELPHVNTPRLRKLTVFGPSGRRSAFTRRYRRLAGKCRSLCEQDASKFTPVNGFLQFYMMFSPSADNPWRGQATHKYLLKSETRYPRWPLDLFNG